MRKQFLLTVTAILCCFASFATIMGPSSLCVGGTTTLMDSLSTGGTWASSNTAVATIGSSTGMVSGLSAGTTVIMYVSGSYTSSMTMTVYATPTIAISGATLVCVSGSTTLSAAASGGYWNSDDYTVADVDFSTGVVTGISAGTTNISYLLSPGCGSGVTVTVGSIPLGVIGGDSILCVGATGTVTETLSGGIWSSGDPSVATVSSTGTLTGVAPGFAPISYTLTGACGSASAILWVMIDSGTSAGIYGPSVVYTGASNMYFAGTGGGVWSSSNPAAGTIDASGVLTGIAPGTTTLTYSVTGCGGPATGTMNVTVVNYDVVEGDIYYAPGYSCSTQVWLIHYNTATMMLEAVDSTYTAGTGSMHYAFYGVPTDSFRIKAAPADSAFATSGYLPTYHTSSFYWHSANVLYHTSGVSDAGVDINMMVGTPVSGPGFIGGSVLAGANKGTSGGVPVQGLQMVLVNSATGAVVRQARTDASGNYAFSSVPVGFTYYVFPDSLNYLTTPYTGITLTSADASRTSIGFEQHTISKTITPKMDAVTDVNNMTSLVVYPNPSTGRINVWTAKAGPVSINVTDAAGRQVYSTNLAANAGVAQADLSTLPNGLYVIKVQSADVNYTGRLELRK